MRKPKEIEAINSDGESKTFIIHKFFASDGEEILSALPSAAIPKMTDLGKLKESIGVIFKYVGVMVEGRDDPLMLTTKALMDNHVEDVEQKLRILQQIIGYNFSFFQLGGGSTFFESLIKKHLPLIIQTATDSLRQSSEQG